MPLKMVIVTELLFVFTRILIRRIIVENFICSYDDSFSVSSYACELKSCVFSFSYRLAYSE